MFQNTGVVQPGDTLRPTHQRDEAVDEEALRRVSEQPPAPA